MAQTVTMSETAVLVNPAAGGGRAGRTWERLLAHLPELAAATAPPTWRRTRCWRRAAASGWPSAWWALA